MELSNTCLYRISLISGDLLVAVYFVNIVTVLLE